MAKSIGQEYLSTVFVEIIFTCVIDYNKNIWTQHVTHVIYNVFCSTLEIDFNNFGVAH